MARSDIGLLVVHPAERDQLVAQGTGFIGGDTGRPVTLRDAGDPCAAAYVQMAKDTAARLSAIGGPNVPSIEISD